MKITKIDVLNSKILGNLHLNFVNPKTNEPYKIVAFVGENSSGKTTILNEIFRYCENTMIKSGTEQKHMHAVFVRQNSAYANAMNELTEKISGGDAPFPVSSKKDQKQDASSTKKSSNLKGIKIIEELDNEKILKIYKSDSISSILCSGIVGKMIDNKTGSVQLSELSSGEQEIILKLKSIGEILTDTDVVLFDEPETSLHPRWQQKIVKFVREITEGENNESPQIFIATHSEKVLESIVDDEDTLIIHVYKENGIVNIEPLYEIPFCLSKPTFAELNYLIFKINSYDYHNLLITELGCLIGKDDKMHAIDKYIKHHTQNKENILKPWIFTRKDMIEQFDTLPIFIRNNFHHPRKDVQITDEELNYSILTLRALIKEIIDNKDLLN